MKTRLTNEEINIARKIEETINSMFNGQPLTEEPLNWDSRPVVEVGIVCCEDGEYWQICLDETDPYTYRTLEIIQKIREEILKNDPRGIYVKEA